ncbi:hypothetical protein Fmac_010875 [Flemingia macrophylla]|uniref:Protein kinase domain-containing protein n=1 Tax=Flemingia macrophylla TaxID=520843 RepID=A0ABD1MKW5_9FABA
MPSKRLQWKSLVLGCFKAKTPSLESPKIVSKKTSSSRIFLSDVSDYSSLSIMSDLSNSLLGSNLHIFTYQELKEITHGFSKINILGEGGFGKVYKGFIDDNLRPGLKARTVAVKALNLDGKQGHREWLDYNSKLSDFGLAIDGPEKDQTHITTNVMGTRGYAAPEYMNTGHLTTMSDVYSFGVVLLELLTGKKSVDKKRPIREQDLVEWARPLLKDSHKVERIIDPKLEGQYSTEGARKFASLAYQCLSPNAKCRPSMRTVVKTLEPLLELKDIPVGPFVYVVPGEEDLLKVNEKGKENDCGEINQGELKAKEEQKVEKKEKGHQRQRKSRRNRRRVKPLRSRAVYSDTDLYKTLGTNLYSPKQAP